MVNEGDFTHTIPDKRFGISGAKCSTSDYERMFFGDFICPNEPMGAKISYLEYPSIHDPPYKKY